LFNNNFNENKMIFQYKKIAIFAAFSLFSATILLAQPGKKPPKDLDGENVEVIKDFDARLLDANKVDLTPTLPALDTSTQRQTYVVPPKGLQLKYAAPKLRPVGFKTESVAGGYNGYAKLGAGVPTSLYGEVGYGYSTGKSDFKGWVRHHSANSKAVDNQRFMQNDLLLSAISQIAPNTSIEGKLGYSLDDFYYFGYDHDLPANNFTAEGSRQRFKLADLSARLFNSEKTATDLNFSAEPKFYSLRDGYASKETGFSLGLSATKWFAEKHALRVTIRPDFTTFEDTTKQKLNNIYIQPSFTFSHSKFRAKIGGNFVSNKDIFHIYPDIDLTLRVWGDGLVIFGGWNGDLRKNSFRSLTEYNPYLGTNPNDNTRILIKNTDFQQYFGGVKGNLGIVEYAAQVGYGKAKDLAMFQNDWSAQGNNGAFRRFKVLYDTARIFNLTASGKIHIAKNLVINASFSQSIIDPKYQLHAWHLPTTDGNFGATMKVLEDKLTVRANLYIANQTWYLDRTATPKRTNALLDLSFGGHYQIAKNFGAFLDLNNLVNNKYEKFKEYPTYGLNILGGITVKF
jgi:hypothetical protein